MAKNNIYLDHNATTPLRPEALQAINAAMAAPHNASSVHTPGRAAHKIIEDAREKISALVKCPAAQIIFNSGATEGNNTVLKYFAANGEHILVSAIEHPSVLEAAPKSEKIPVTKDGVVDLEALEKMLKASPPYLPACGGEERSGGGDARRKAALVSVMMVNNETGAIQPIMEISALAHRYGALFHCDAVQAAGKIAIDMPLAGIDFLTLSAHKLGGPQGVGALCLGLCGITPTLLDGGGQEKKARAGTQNTAGIAGFAAAAEAARTNLKDSLRLEELRRYLEKSLLAATPGLIIHAANAPRVPNTTLFSLPGASSETMLMALDLEGLYLSNGSACSSGSVQSSHVLKAMHVPEKTATATIRLSTGWPTTQNDIDIFLETWEKIVTRIKR